MTVTTANAIGVAARILGALGRVDEPLGARTTYRVGGRAALLVEIADEGDLETVAEALGESGAEVLVIGKGSNLLVADRGFPGVVVALGDRFSECTIDRDAGVVSAGGALALPILARRCAAAGVAGLEWAVGIPGSVGGAVRMNAGGHGAETADRVIDARIFDLEAGAAHVSGPEELALSYRHSSLRPWDLVLSARFTVGPGDVAASESEIARIVAWRRANQPGGRNGGSVFSNPNGESAGRLIDEAGLKGLRVGTAVVSEKHANFFLVDEGGSADDVARLIDVVREAVAARTGITLKTELRLVGFAP